MRLHEKDQYTNGKCSAYNCKWCGYIILTSCCIPKVLDTLQVNAVFACDFLTTEHHDGVLLAIITLAYTVLAMVHPRWFTCDDLLATATRNNHHMNYHRKGNIILEPMVKTIWKSDDNWPSNQRITSKIFSM